ncbi:hypothetical protein [Cryptosporangium minutisporangium]|uniref:hypothetical protein n=1 Tax=Cryptosporangium minutisporangium TaxID=113569 RepID=UPI0035EEE4B3
MSNSELEPEAEPKLKAEENSDSIVVVDPDDYQKTQKLKAINEAKKEYRRYKRQKTEILQKLEENWRNHQEAYEAERAMRLAEYGTELMPLIEEGLEKGALTEEDMKCSLGDGFREVDIRKVVRNGGWIFKDGETEPIPTLNSDEVYRQLERIERKLGLGLELETDKGPSEI